MTPKLCCFHIARFVLQAETAFAVNSGLRDGAFDSLIVKDANELPAIPGTSLAGVLRHQFKALHGDQVQAVFGYAEQDRGEASRLHVSWGCVHDSHDRPVEGIRFDLNKDPVLERLQQDHPFHRERVRINERGIAQDGGKFDLTVIPAGCRFSFEMSYWSDSKDDDPHWRNILTLLHLPLQIGASTRSGLGWFRLERLAQRSLDLKNQEDWDTYKQIGFSLADTGQLESGFEIKSSVEPIQATLKLKAEDFWRFGQSGEAFNKAGKTPDATPLIEPVIAWKDNKAYFTPKQVVIPASGVKGALWHRVQFHYECLKWNEDVIEQGSEDEAANILFGFANNNQPGKESAGQAGLILFRDFYPENIKNSDAAHLTHNSIDRFTGGVRDKVLYTEEVIWRQEFKLILQIDPVRLGYLEKDETKKKQLALYKKALKSALDDLIEGRLALGAGSAKGHGYFSGSITWTDNGNWIGAGND